jgi:hypothetical protein
MESMAANDETTASLKRRTLKRVEGVKVHPRESFDEAISRLLVEKAALDLIARKDPELADRARHQALAAATA